MRNFKNTFIILLLISLFSCHTQGISEDETPAINTPASSIFEEVKPPSKKSLTINITVQYPDNWDKAAVRVQIGPALDLQSWAICSARGDVETWTITPISEAEFLSILAPFNVEAKSLGSAGASDPYAKDPTEPIFFYEDICQ